MELGELKVFLAVASERSFSRAAAKLYKTQPAVSQAVRRLEEQLEERLFDRATKNATLTPAGDVLFREGARLLQLAEATTAAVRRQSERQRGILTIGGDELGAHAVLPALGELLQRQPSLHIEFRRISERHVVGEVAAATIDVGIVTTIKVPSQFRQIQLPSPEAGYTVLLPRSHPLARHQTIVPHMLHGERVVVLSDPLYLTGPFQIAPAESAPVVIMRMPGLDSLKRAVEMELGIGVIPSGTAGAPRADSTLVARPLRDGQHVPTVTLVYRATDSESPGTAAFLAVISNAKRSVTSQGEQSDGRRTAAHI